MGTRIKPDSRWARRRFRLVGAAALAVALVVSLKFRKPIEDRFDLLLAERAITAGRLDEAEDRLAILIEKHPARAWPRFLAARVAREQGRTTEAEERLQRALDLGLPVAEARPEHLLLREASGESVITAPPILRK